MQHAQGWVVGPIEKQCVEAKKGGGFTSMLTPSFGSFVGVPSSFVVEMAETLLLRGGIVVGGWGLMSRRGCDGSKETRDIAPIVLLGGL